MVRDTVFGPLAHGGCSSAGRAPGCGPGCRGFEPRHSPQGPTTGTTESGNDRRWRLEHLLPVSRQMSAMSISTARLSAATYAGRLAGAASRLAGRGTGASIRGKVMLKLDPSALSKLLVDKRIAIVSGTNGKTTTTHFLA